MGEHPYRVLLIDDDDKSIESVSSILRSENFTVSVARDTRQAMHIIGREPPDVIVMEHYLEDAIESYGLLRDTVKAPLLVVARNGAESAAIEALDAGADDFLRKPVPSGEFLARIRALLRRAASVSGPAKLRAGPLELDAAKRQVTIGGTEISLTRTEFDILGALMQNDGRTVSYQKLLEFVWGSTPDEGIRALRVHIAHLRKKIEPNPGKPQIILTEPGVGYRIDSGLLQDAPRAETA